MKTKRAQFKISGEVIHPGESLSLALQLPELYSCLPAYMPIKIFHGKKSGPTLLIVSAINGDELNGTEILNRLVNFQRIKKLNGTLIVVPVVNVFGLANKSKFLPGNIALSQSFPGSKHGTHAERLAHLFISEIFDLADYVLSLETGPLNYSRFPELSTELELEDCKEIAKFFGAPVILPAENKYGSLTTYAKKEKKKLLTYTAGEASRFDFGAIKVGLRGILNIMGFLKMIPDIQIKTTKTSPTFFIGSTKWVRSSHTGISTNKVKLGSHVTKGTALCSINDPFGNYYSQQVLSPSDGVIIGINNVPLVTEGEALFKLAVLHKEDSTSNLENWNKFVED